MTTAARTLAIAAVTITLAVTPTGAASAMPDVSRPGGPGITRPDDPGTARPEGFRDWFCSVMPRACKNHR